MTEYKPDGSWVKYDSEGNVLEAGYDANTYTGDANGGDAPGGNVTTGDDGSVGMTIDYTRNADGSTSWTEYDANGNVIDTGIEIDASALNGPQPQPRELQATPQSQPRPNGNGTAARQTPAGTGLQNGTGSRVTPADAQAALNLHNQARREVGNRPMQWSSTLAQDAQRIADSLAARGVFDHEGRNAENLSAGTPSAESATRNFLEEKRLYQQGERAGMKVRHYTQMVWHNTTDLGIGIAVYQSGPYRGRHVVVARYNPGGNMMGEEAYRGAGVIHW